MSKRWSKNYERFGRAVADLFRHMSTDVDPGAETIERIQKLAEHYGVSLERPNNNLYTVFKPIEGHVFEFNVTSRSLSCRKWHNGARVAIRPAIQRLLINPDVMFESLMETQ